MKKMLLMLGVAAAAMTSCTSDEVLEMNPTNAIKFESFVNKGTRAVTELSTSNLTGFYVIGGYNSDLNNAFNNVSIGKDGTTSVYWVDDQTYHFAAYTNGDNTKFENASFAYVSTLPTLTFTGYTVDDAKDLVADLALSQDGTQRPTVALTLQHLLSQVNFQFKNSQTTQDGAITMTISDVEFTSMKSEATCTYTEDNEGVPTITWANGTSGVYSYTKTFGGESFPTTTTKGQFFTTESHLVIPGQDLTNVKVAFKATFYSGNEIVDIKDCTGSDAVSLKTATVEKWLPGYRYTYIAELPAKPGTINFSVNVGRWTDESTSNTDISPSN